MSGTTTKKMLQSIKEIVGANFSDDEIYATLKDCNMDPSEAVHRLLNQDSFQEVKNKREKKKDVKDNTESRARTVTSSNRSSKGASDRAARASSTQTSSNANYNKPMARRESGINAAAPVSSVSSPAPTKNYPPPSDFFPLNAGGASSVPAPDLLPPSYSKGAPQNTWSTMPGQRTLADIVKMGRPSGKVGQALPPVMSTNSEASSHDFSMNAGNEHLAPKIPSSHSKPAESLNESTTSSDANILFAQGDSMGHHLSDDSWLLLDQPKAGSGGFADVPAPLILPVEVVDLHRGSQLDQVHIPEKGSIEGGVLSEDSSTRDPRMDDSLGTDASSFQHDIHNFKRDEIDVDKVEIASELQRLGLEKDDASVKQHLDDNPAVIIPNHLQVTNADCSYLSFGTFGSGINTAFSGSFGSKTQETSNLEADDEASEPAPVQVEDNTDARNPEYFGNERLRVDLSENTESNRSSTNVENYEAPSSSSQPDVIRSDSTDGMDGLTYRMQSSLPGYTFSNTGEPIPGAVPPYASVQGNSPMQSLAPFSNVMQAYPSSLPGNLLSSSVPPQEYDLPPSLLLATQSMPTKYGTTMSSISGASVSMPETTVKPGGSFSAAAAAMQNMPASSVPPGASAVPQHLPPVAQYSQPTLPLGPFANMIGYPFLPSYTYMPSAAAAAFQQALAGGTTYHQSPVAALHAAGLKYTLPQYKNTATAAVGNLPLSAAVPSGLPGFGGSPTLPGSHHLLLNPSGSASVSPYDDLLSAQYKEQQSHQYSAPPSQQSESSMWMHGSGGSRAPTGLSSAAAYYNLHQGPSQLGGAFRQSQQPSPYGGAAGYPNFYHSQGSAAGQQEHLHSSSDGRLSGGQGQAPPPAAAHQHQHQHQMWQHNY